MLGYLSKWVRQTLVILGMLLGFSPVAFAQASLENGTYTLTNNVAHDNPVGQGMARSYTEEQSDLVVNKDGLWLTLGFNNTQYMGEFKIKVNGSQASYEVVYNSNNIKKLKFKVPSLDASIAVGMPVIPMNTEVEYTVTLNKGSLKLIEKEAVEKVKPEEPVTKPESNSGNSPQTGNNTQDNNQTVTKPSASTQTGTQSSSQPQVGAETKPEQSTKTQVDAQTKPKQNTKAQVGAQTKPEQSTNMQASTVPSDNSIQTQTQTKVEEESIKVEKQVETSGSSEQEEVVLETEKLVKEESEVQGKNEVQESDVEETTSEAVENQEVVEEKVLEEKGSLIGTTIVIVVLVALAGGLYYWYFKIRK